MRAQNVACARAYLDPVGECVADRLVVLEPRGRQAGDVGVRRAAEQRALPGCKKMFRLIMIVRTYDINKRSVGFQSLNKSIGIDIYTLW